MNERSSIYKIYNNCMQKLQKGNITMPLYTEEHQQQRELNKYYL